MAHGRWRFRTCGLDDDAGPTTSRPAGTVEVTELLTLATTSEECRHMHVTDTMG